MNEFHKQLKIFYIQPVYNFKVGLNINNTYTGTWNLFVLNYKKL